MGDKFKLGDFLEDQKELDKYQIIENLHEKINKLKTHHVKDEETLYHMKQIIFLMENGFGNLSQIVKIRYEDFFKYLVEKGTLDKRILKEIAH